MPTLLLSFLKNYWLELAAFIVAVAIGFGLAWQIQGTRLDRTEIAFEKYQGQVEQQAIEDRRAALDKEKFWLQEIENARINAQTREAKLKKDVAAAQSTVGGLRHDLDTLQARLATSSCATCVSAAATLGDLLGQCSEDYRAMAEIADRHAIDVQTLTIAWPK